MFARREGLVSADFAINHPTTTSPSIFKKGVHFESTNNNNKRRVTTSFLASMNFQDNHKRQKLVPKKPDEGRITWSNVYEAAPMTQVPKVKVDDSRGSLLVWMGGGDNKQDTSPASPASPGTSSWKALADAIPVDDVTMKKTKPSAITVVQKDKEIPPREDMTLQIGKKASVGQASIL